ncbi:acid phosphatase 1-like [Jatropha curcas]|uniref:acid phosphatase 1-like n=1 Tax=Jatropha curcas TaxID=180498 RepID=UPI0018953AB7|nr:acid phosphatase 1-like [Jatropha curcas]
MKEAKAPALEQSLKLFDELKDKGIKIFIVSSRSETLRSATVDNLINVGYHGWSRLLLRGLEDQSMKVQEYQSQARKELMDERYLLWAVIGAQWSSLECLPYAKRTFKLPNSMYYIA